MDDLDELPDDETPLGWEWRVFAVALFWSLPGVVAGALVGLALSAADVAASSVPLAAGGAIGLLIGGLLEADGFGRRPGEPGA